MDPKEFKRRLEELVELQPIKVANVSNRKPEETTVVFREGEEIFIDDKENHTLTYKVKRIKNDVRKCEDCSKKIKNRTVSTKLYTFPVKHWRNLCNNCNMFQHPETKKYCLVGVSSQNVWNKFLKNTHPDLINKPEPELEEIGEIQSEILVAEKKPAK